MRSKRPFSDVKEWRAKDQHTGIDKSAGVPYTYRHLVGRTLPKPPGECYRIETFIRFSAPTAVHGNVHYVPGAKLDAFFAGWGQHGETVIDIRPMTLAAALDEIANFRLSAERADAP